MNLPASRADIEDALVTWFMGQVTHAREPETGQPIVDDDALDDECRIKAQAVFDLLEGTDNGGIMLLLEAHQRVAIDDAFARSGRPLPPGAPF